MPDENLPPLIITPPGRYRHYKGGLYTVTGLCRIEATLEVGVLYQPLQGSEQVTWMRPYSQFTDKVHLGGSDVPRFSLEDPTPTKVPDLT